MLRRLFLRHERILYLLALAATVAMVAIPMYRFLHDYLVQPYSDPYSDIDWKFICNGLAKVHSFADTGRWWTGNWAGPFIYWRPLSSYVWYFMTLLWKPDAMLPREIVLLVLHAVYLVLCGILVYKITGRKWLTLLSIYIYAGWIPPILGGPTQSVVRLLHDPKNLPDVFAGICMAASLILLVDKRYYLAILPACIGVLFKEIGFVVWGVAVILLFAMKRWKSVPGGAIASWTAALVLLAMCHWLAVGLVSADVGKAFWHIRMAKHHLGSILNSLFSPNAGATVTAAILVFVLSRGRNRSLIITLLGVLGALGVGAVINAVQSHIPFVVGLVQLLDTTGLQWTLFCTVWLGTFYLARRDFIIALPYFLISLVAAAPTYATLVAPHGLYESDLFAAIFTAIVIAGVFNRLKSAVPSTPAPR